MTAGAAWAHAAPNRGCHGVTDDFSGEVTVSQADLARTMRQGIAGICNSRETPVMQPESLTAACFCCDTKLHFTPDSDAGQVIERYGVVVCTPCFQANAAGWAPRYEEKLLRHLQRSHIAPPARNASGLLPRE